MFYIYDFMLMLVSVIFMEHTGVSNGDLYE